MNAEEYAQEFKAGERTRSIARRIGSFAMVLGGYSLLKYNLGADEAVFVKTGTIISGMLVLLPTIRSWQEWRYQGSLFDDGDDEDGNGDWPPDDDPDHPIIPNDPGGLVVDWGD